MQPIYLYFENGMGLEARSFGSSGTQSGEIIFNTSMSGYQEILSDPSYIGQFVVFTMPEIGIVGVNPQDVESYSGIPTLKGIIVQNANEYFSNFRAQDSLFAYLKAHNIMGITHIDTRVLTKLIRDCGAMNIIASTEISSFGELKKNLESSRTIKDINYINDISIKQPKTHKKGTYSFEKHDFETPRFSKKIIAIDFGIKQNILNELSSVGLECEVVGHDFCADDIIERFKNKEIGGVFLSNGPGNPAILTKEIIEIKKLISAKIPMFGICLGHQLLSIAHGFDTYKLRFGHHGANHPVKNMLTNKIEITAQNHIYSVPEEIESIAEVTHKNLFDGTIEGLRYKDSPIISVQHHPEASPGPKEAAKIFRDFFDMVEGCK